MSLTLLEAAKSVQNPLQRGVVEIFARTSPVLQLLPFTNINGQAYRYNVEESAPGIGFRGINESWTERTGVINPQVEPLFILGGLSAVDRALVRTQGSINDLRSIYDTMKAKSAALEYTKQFFVGSNATDPNSFDGLASRLTGNQVVDQGSTSGGDTLTLAKLDEALDQVIGGADAIFCNRTIRRKISALVRAAGAAIETVSDLFGRQLTGYAGVPIYPIETDKDGVEILGFTEDAPGGGASVCTSIYCVKFGALEFVGGLQAGMMEVLDLGLNRTKYETLVEWITGMAIFHPRSASRLQGIKNA